MYKEFSELSPSLNKALTFFIDRIDMTQRDREIFYDIVGFTFDEGKIKGKEEYLQDKTKEDNGE